MDLDQSPPRREIGALSRCILLPDVDVKLPRLAEDLVEATVSRWLRRPGDRLREGEPLVEVETDKVNSELEAPADGVLSEILAPEGTTVPVGQVIARIVADADS